MGCDCGRDLSPQSIIDLFWSGIIIRFKDYQDIIDMIRTKKSGTGDISQKKYDLFIEGLLIHPDYKEISYKLFIKILNESRKRKNEGIYFISLFFLGKISLENLNKFFILICINQGGLKDSIRNDNENYFIKKKDLEEIIYFYVEMISFMGIDFISEISENKDIFKSELNNKFFKENMEKFINKYIFDIFNNDDEINVEKFLKEKGKILVNDSHIREILIQNINE
jgi:hypothetical protein